MNCSGHWDDRRSGDTGVGGQGRELGSEGGIVMGMFGGMVGGLGREFSEG